MKKYRKISSYYIFLRYEAFLNKCTRFFEFFYIVEVYNVPIFSEKKTGIC